MSLGLKIILGTFVFIAISVAIVSLINDVATNAGVKKCLADEGHTFESFKGKYFNCCYDDIEKIIGGNSHYRTVKKCYALPSVEESKQNNLTKDMLTGNYFQHTIAAEIIKNNTFSLER